MDWVGWIIGVIGVLVTVLTSYSFYRRGEGSRNTKAARKEVVGILINHLANDNQDLNTAAVEALLNNKYRDCNIGSLTSVELPIIVEDLITTLVENIFITPERRQVLVGKALNLKQSLQPRVSSLEEEVRDWGKLSIRNIVLQTVSMIALGIGSGFIIVVVGVFLNPILFHRAADDTSFLQQLGLVVLATALLAVMQYDKLAKRRERRSRSLDRVLEDSVMQAIKRNVPGVTFERNVLVGSAPHVTQVDLVAILNGMKFPVEVSHGSVRRETIEKVSTTMRQMGCQKGVIVSSSKVGNRIERVARQTGIVLVDGVTSETDLGNLMKDTRLSEQ